MKKNKEKDHYLLYATVFPVKGYCRSMLYDLQLNKIELIPNDIYTLLSHGFTYEDIVNYSLSLPTTEISQFVKYLMEKGYVFRTKTPNFFPPISLEYNDPSIISNAIIEIANNSISTNYFDLILQHLAQYGCKAIEIRCISSLSSNEITQIISILKHNYIDDVTIITPYDQIISDHLIDISKPILSIKKIVQHGANENDDIVDNHRHIILSKKKIENHFCEGKISPELFTVNMDFFLEAQEFNVCLNKKLCIDFNGNIKNCLNFTESYGNILNENFANILANMKFQKMWNINKDMIPICNICEFRYMCFDCRASAENLLSRPICDYNPFIAKWKNDPTYIPVENCGYFTEELVYIPDHEKIRAFNKDHDE